jgi:hypothetical protein
MKHLSISKFENSNDKSWTSFSDIGQEVGEDFLTLETYIKTESMYVDFVFELFKLSSMKVNDFKIKNLEDNRGQFNGENYYTGIEYPKIKLCGGENTNESQLSSLIKLSLRDLLWLRLESETGAYITFGHDFYLHVGIPEGIDLDESCFSRSHLNVTLCDEDPHE